MIRIIEIGIAGIDLQEDYLSLIEDFASSLEVRASILERLDGGILVTAEGEELKLLEFAKKLETGGIFDTVLNFYSKWMGEAGPENFHVSYDKN